jgi:hypothetical protein
MFQIQFNAGLWNVCCVASISKYVKIVQYKYLSVLDDDVT